MFEARRIVALATLCSFALPAQVPLDQVVISSFRDASLPGSGGLWFFDPGSNAVTPVLGEPCGVVGSCVGAAALDGADFVVRLPGTQQIVTNGWGPIGVPLRVFVLTIAGAPPTVVASNQYDVAMITNWNGLGGPAAAVLPDGRVLLAIDPNNCGAPGPLAGALLGILDPQLPPTNPASVQPMPLSSIPPGFVNGLAIDANAGVAYIALLNSLSGPFVSHVWAVPIPGGGTPVLVTGPAGIAGGINSLCVEPDGSLLAGGFADPGPSRRLHRIVPSTGAVSTFAGVGGAGVVHALRLDPVTGDLWATSQTFLLRMAAPRSAATSTFMQMSAGPVGGWGQPSGLDMHSRLRPYGSASGATPFARWSLAPNPGGTPTAGQAFSLTSTLAPAPLLTAWVLGTAPLAATPVPLPPGIELLVTPDIVAAAGTTVAFPAPAAAAGQTFFVQCGHFTAAGTWTATEGLRIQL